MGIDKTKKTFTTKPYSGFLYKWSPETSLDKSGGELKSGLPTYCDALPFSQGEDWVTTYSFKFEVVDGIEHHYAYVACDYVK